MSGYIFFIELNIRGAWVIYGRLGVRQYYGYTKAQSKQRYIDECKKKLFDNKK
jgi:hypothetical protein